MNHTKFLTGLVAGLSIGIVATILLSPEKGSVTRQRIIDKSSALGNSLTDYFTGLVKRKKTNDTPAVQSPAQPMRLNTMG